MYTEPVMGNIIIIGFSLRLYFGFEDFKGGLVSFLSSNLFKYVKGTG
jgi:hypothetical protein